MSDDNRDILSEKLNNFGLSFQKPNVESETIKFHDFNSEFGSPVSTKNLQMNPDYHNTFFPGMQVSTNQLIGTLENPEDVFDTLYPTNTIPQAPAMFAVNFKNSLNQESGKDAAAGDIKRSRKSTKINSILVARMYLYSVNKFDCYYQISGIYRTLQNQLVNFDFSFDYKKYAKNFYRAFIDNNVDCFNEKLKPDAISGYLKTIIEKKAILQCAIPNKHGFYLAGQTWTFISDESCKYYKIPPITNKHFYFRQPFMPDVITENFVNVAKNNEDPLLFMLLNVIRIASLCSTPLNRLNATFCKVIVIKGDYNKISPYLQIYNRLIENTKEQSVNIQSEKALEMMSEYKDDIFLLNDENYSSDFKQRNGKETIRKISDRVAGYDPETDITEMQKYPFITCVVSNRLSSALDGKSLMMIDASSLNRNISVSSSEVDAMYRLDELLIQQLCSQFVFMNETIDKEYSKYKNEKQFKYNSSNMVYCICMKIYNHIYYLMKTYSEVVVEKELFSIYLEKVLRISEEIDNYNTIENDFINVINNAVLSDNPDEKIELVYHSKLSGCYGETKNYPVIYREGSKLLIHDDVFKILASRMIITDTGCHIRKALDKKGLLYSTDNLKSKVRLHGKRYSGDFNLTVLSEDILSDEAKNATVGGDQNYTPCIYNEEQIFLGYNQDGKKIGLYNERNLNAGITIIGKNTQWTSKLADLIALQLSEKNELVFFIDETGSTIVNNLRGYGFDGETIEEMVYETDNIHDLIFDEDVQEIYLENDSRKIFSLCGNDIEEILSAFLKAKKSVKDRLVYLVLHTTGEFERKVNTPFYELMKKVDKLNVIVISVYESFDDLKGRYSSIVNKSDIKMIFNEYSTDAGKMFAIQNNIKPSSEFGELVFSQKEDQFILTGILKDIEGNDKNGRFIQLKLPGDEGIIELFT